MTQSTFVPEFPFPELPESTNTTGHANDRVDSGRASLSSAHPSAPRERTHAGSQAGGDRCPDLVCLSHLRWDFVFQRPQHVMTRFAADRRVFFVEEPIFDGRGADTIGYAAREHGVVVVTPHLDPALDGQDLDRRMRDMIDRLFIEQRISDPVLWYYTPMAIAFSRHLSASLVVWDCMDELSAFAGASSEMLERERELLARADLVFTGGQSLYEAKRDRHPRVHAFPSSIDLDHFISARSGSGDPADQSAIPHPRIGFYGVLDERLDIELIAGVARARPDWHLVLIGPVAKIDPRSLPQAPNIHYLGKKDYAQLPSYLAGWDAAILPFARNESTRFISPTKTPEYLAAGRPVVSTAIRDVVRPYADEGLVLIADEPQAFVDRLEEAMAQGRDGTWLARVDDLLRGNSWDRTQGRMRGLIEACLADKRERLRGEAETLDAR